MLFRSYPQTLGKMARSVDYVDLRYPNGFALRIPEFRNPGFRKLENKRV